MYITVNTTVKRRTDIDLFRFSVDGRPFEVLSDEEKEHRIAEVASRLKLIGDKAVERYNTESSSSGLESPQGQGHTARAGEFLDVLNSNYALNYWSYFVANLFADFYYDYSNDTMNI